jgi:hypothetical protein
MILDSGFSMLDVTPESRKFNDGILIEYPASSIQHLSGVAFLDVSAGSSG